MNLVPVLQLPPLELLPPASLPSEADLVRLFHGRSPKPCKVVSRKATCPEPGGCQDLGVPCVLSQMKQSWVEIGIPVKERDDDILKVMSKVQDKFRKVKKNVAKMKEDTRQSHVQELSGRTVNLGPGNIREKIMSDWHLPARIKKSIMAIVEDYLGKNATR